MKLFIQFKQFVPRVRDSVLLISLLMLTCFALLPRAQAVSPAPDGGYPGGNTAEGQAALFSLTTGGYNTGIGFLSLRSNTTGSFNTAVGAGTLLANTGEQNTATGAGALLSTTIGTVNTADGGVAGSQLTGNNNIDIGYNVVGLAGESNATRIGNSGITDTYISGIFGQTVVAGTAVFVNSDRKLGTSTSSARFKEAIRPMGAASEAILALRPVSFRYKKEIDPRGLPEFGLVAEEVEAVNSDLVVRDKEGKPYSVRYDQVNAMLLNEFLKEHRKVEQLTKDFESKLAEQQNQIEALSAGLQKVSAEVEMSRAAPQMAVNDQ
jgi:hypothetical protein